MSASLDIYGDLHHELEMQRLRAANAALRQQLLRYGFDLNAFVSARSPRRRRPRKRVTFTLENGGKTL